MCIFQDAVWKEKVPSEFETAEVSNFQFRLHKILLKTHTTKTFENPMSVWFLKIPAKSFIITGITISVGINCLVAPEREAWRNEYCSSVWELYHDDSSITNFNNLDIDQHCLASTVRWALQWWRRHLANFQILRLVTQALPVPVVTVRSVEHLLVTPVQLWGPSASASAHWSIANPSDISSLAMASESGEAWPRNLERIVCTELKESPKNHSCK